METNKKNTHHDILRAAHPTHRPTHGTRHHPPSTTEQLHPHGIIIVMATKPISPTNRHQFIPIFGQFQQIQPQGIRTILDFPHASDEIGDAFDAGQGADHVVAADRQAVGGEEREGPSQGPAVEMGSIDGGRYLWGWLSW